MEEFDYLPTCNYCEEDSDELICTDDPRYNGGPYKMMCPKCQAEGAE
jgi:hypothetical protein